LYRVMIVDDEPVIRKYIISFISWQALGCKVVYEARNGCEALEYIKLNHVDIIIADIRMSGMDGIELSKYICQNYPFIKVIILTAYADFAYAQSALRYNVVDFVVKTNPDEKLVEAIKKAIILIEQQKEIEKKMKHLEDKVCNSIIEMTEKLIIDIINGIITNPKDIENKAKALNLDIKNYFIIAFLVLKTHGKGNAPEHNDSILMTTQTEYNNLPFSIKKFISLALKKYNHYTATINKHLLVAIVSFENSDKNANIKPLIITCNDILKMSNNFMKFNISIGISQMHSRLYRLPQAFREALNAVSWKFSGDSGISVFTEGKHKNITDFFTIARKYIDQIINFIREGDQKNAISALTEFFSELKSSCEPVERIKGLSMLLCSHCFSLLPDPDMELFSHSENETDILRQIQECHSAHSLFVLIRSVIISVSEKIRLNTGKKNYLVREVNQFIKQNYKYKVSLTAIARQLHINSSYLSRVYKKETGISITEALNRYRIEKAKKLLDNSTNKIFEVASSVGIEDPAYFTHVFTKYCGQSPSEYQGK
jgi:two-component system response regulator YesN